MCQRAGKHQVAVPSLPFTSGFPSVPSEQDTVENDATIPTPLSTFLTFRTSSQAPPDISHPDRTAAKSSGRYLLVVSIHGASLETATCSNQCSVAARVLYYIMVKGSAPRYFLH